MQQWIPKTKLALAIGNKLYSNLEDLLRHSNLTIKESEIVDLIEPNLKREVLLIRKIQKTVTSGKKMRYSVLVCVGNENGVVGIGFGKQVEMKKSIEIATKAAKKNLIFIAFDELRLTICKQVQAKVSSSVVTLKPGPKGLGIVANEALKKITKISGIKDIWIKIRGSKNKLNYLQAWFKALQELSYKYEERDFEKIDSFEEVLADTTQL